MLSVEQIHELARLTVKDFQEKGLVFKCAALVGSAGILPSPELAKDIDILFLLEENTAIRPTVQPYLSSEYIWGYDEGTYPLDDFESLRYENLNLLFVNKQKVFTEWLLAVNICRALKLSARESRVLVHQIIMDGLVIEGLFPLAYNLELLNG